MQKEIVLEAGQMHHHAGAGRTTVVKIVSVVGTVHVNSRIAGHDQQVSAQDGMNITTTSGSPDDFVAISATENSRAEVEIHFD